MFLSSLRQIFFLKHWFLYIARGKPFLETKLTKTLFYDHFSVGNCQKDSHWDQMENYYIHSQN